MRYILFIFVSLVLSCVPQSKNVSEVEVYEKDVVQRKEKIFSLGDVPANWVQGHFGYVYYIDISSDGKMMVSGGSDKYIRIWDISELPKVNQVKATRRLYQSIWGPPVKFSKDDKYIFSGSYDFIEVFDKDLNFIDNIRISSGGIQSIDVFDRYLVASDVNGFVYKLSFDGRKLKLEDKKKVHNDEIWKVKNVFSDKYIVTASLDKVSKVLSLDTFNILNELRAHAGPLEFIDSSQDKIALFSADSYISLWDSNFRLIGKIFDEDRRDIIVGIFDRTGRYLISGGKSCMVKIWDVETFQMKRVIKWHSNDIMAIRVSKDNKFIIVGDRDGKISIWNF
ncbi:MAG: WD40 repeat domain-containing protein [Brevinematia bacterium]